MQRPAKPWTPVRFRPQPPNICSKLCPGGGIGRHKGLKIPRLNGRAGSIPAPGTIKNSKNYSKLINNVNNNRTFP